MNGKGGFLRVLEAFIAIAIISGVMTFLYVNQIQGPNQEEAINQLIRIILEKIVSEEALRDNVLNGNIPEIETEIDKFIPPEGELKYHFSICNLNEICDCGSGMGGGVNNCPSDKDIFSSEVSVSVTLGSPGISPKLIRLFVWEK